jgi:hypothetical protein
MCRMSLWQNCFSVILKEAQRSQPPENARFFAPLRMTIVVNEEFCKSLT